MGCYSITGLPPALNVPVPIYAPGWREALWELTMRPPRLTNIDSPKYSWVYLWNWSRSTSPNSSNVLVSTHNKRHYFMASSLSGQDERNPVLWLATRAVKITLSCPFGIAHVLCPARKFPRSRRTSHIIKSVLTKLNRSRWLDIGLALSLLVYRFRVVNSDIYLQQ